MKLNDLYCIVRVAEEAPKAALEQAIAIAKVRDAHLSVMLAAQMVLPTYTPFYSGMVSGLLAEANDRTRALAEATAETVRSTASIAGITAEVSSTLDLVGVSAAAAAVQARLCDLVVIDQTSGYADSRELILEEALFHTGRPVMVATPRRPARGHVHRILVAWDGSAHAARATSDALALFPEIRTVEIVSVLGEKDLSKSLPGADFARHVARKGVETVLTELPMGEGGVAATLDARALATEADLIVMGGFGHSRFREFVLGGVTLKLTQTASVPLFMAY